MSESWTHTHHFPGGIREDCTCPFPPSLELPGLTERPKSEEAFAVPGPTRPFGESFREESVPVSAWVYVGLVVMAFLAGAVAMAYALLGPPR